MRKETNHCGLAGRGANSRERDGVVRESQQRQQLQVSIVPLPVRRQTFTCWGLDRLHHGRHWLQLFRARRRILTLGCFWLAPADVDALTPTHPPLPHSTPPWRHVHGGGRICISRNNVSTSLFQPTPTTLPSFSSLAATPAPHLSPHRRSRPRPVERQCIAC